MQIQTPEQLKQLSIEQLEQLGDTYRHYLLEKLSKHGGHIGPNLGMVEMTIALHYVFDSPKDAMVFDVSHQSYIHKMITGRLDAFMDEDKYDDVSGFTNPLESKHDYFTIGHTSTSISLACGLMKARDLKGNQHNVIAVIGDGSLSGGEAYEGLNNVVEVGTNMIVILNDNEMSIAENHGGIYQNLAQLRQSQGTCANNVFKAIGYDYYYLDDGHDLQALISLFQKVKDTDHPVLLHIHTVKGQGYSYAICDKEKYHAGGPFNLQTGEFLGKKSNVSYEQLTLDYFLKQIEKETDICLINAGTPGLFKANPQIRQQLGKNYVDVGIAEEHAVAMASGMAKYGAKPVFLVGSTFMQRTYDQLSHDLSLNQNPATILVFGGGYKGSSSNTHLGIFDIGMLGNIPNLAYLAPTSADEYLKMLDYAIHQTERPIAIRVPKFEYRQTSNNLAIEEGYFDLALDVQGSKVAVIAVGDYYGLALETLQAFQNHGVHPSLFHPRDLNTVDTKTLDQIVKDHDIVITFEDGVLDGGYGQKVAGYLGKTNAKVYCYGFAKKFHNEIASDELMKQSGLEPESIVKEVLGN